MLLGPLALTTACNEPSSTGQEPVIFDFSPTVSDVGALLYLASHPTVELLAVTLPGTGESDCEPGVRTTRFVLDLAGRSHVPVGCGRDKPLDGYRDWPLAWRAAANGLVETVDPAFPEQPVVDAEDLLAATLESVARPVTIVAVGPLTNIGATLSERPELAAKIARIVVMGGALDVPGNVEAAPAAEWNLYIDPESVRRTLASGVPVLFVGLDATNAVPWNRALLANMGFLETDVGRFEDELVSSRSLEGVYLWDELAAVVAMSPQVVTTQDIRVSIGDDGALRRDPKGAAVRVAVSAEAALATESFLKVLAGGALPTVEPLGAEEMAYLEALASAGASFDTVVARVFAESGDGGSSAPEIVNTLLGAIVDLEAGFQSIHPPSGFLERHQAMLGSLQAITGSVGDVMAALPEVGDDDELTRVFAAFEETGVAADFEAFTGLVRDIEDESLVRGGPAILAVVPDAG